jgi:signal transduction histidine kinase
MATYRNISIRKKLIIIQSATAFLALVICCTIFVINGVQTFRSSAERKMQSVARIVGANSVSPLLFMDAEADSTILSKLHQEMDILDAVVLDKRGKVFAAYYKEGVPVENYNFKYPQPGDDGALDAEFNGDKLLVRYKIYNGNDFLGTLVIRSELTDLKKIITSYLVVAGVVLLLGLLAALVISYFLQRTISIRLLSLVTKTKEVAETGDYSIRVASGEKDEIGILSKEFNGMLMQIDNMQKSLKEANTELEERVELRTKELETANKELESFSYTVSHDLKAPLRAINGFTEILVNKYGDKLDEKGKEIAGVIVANAKKMGRLIEDLLEFSRLGRKEITLDKVSMDEIADQVVAENINNSQGRDVNVKKDKLPPALGDRNLLVQVWTNLIANAFKYSLHKDKAVITIGSYVKDGDNVYFVKDNGAGFDMKYADKLFKVFQRLHGSDEFEGTGVGLAIVSRIITRHGGKVWAEGKVGEGAAFYFSMPKEHVIAK